MLKVAQVGRGATEVAVVVLDQSEWIHAPPRPGEDDAARRRAAKERAISASFSIERFELARDQRGWHFEVEGKATRLEDGLELYVTLTQGEVDLVAAARVAVRRGVWKVSFGPVSAPYPPGVYCANMEFTLGTQPRVRVKHLRRRLDADEQELLDRIFRREFLHLGAPVEVEAQRTVLRDHVRGALDAADRLLDDVERAYGSASRAAFARAVPLRFGCPGRAGLLVVPGVDAAAHRAHLEAIGLAPTEARLARLLTDDRFGAALGQVDGPALRAWLEGEALPAHAALDARVRAFDERTAVPIDSRVSGALALLVDDLVHTLRRSARAMFRTAGVIPPPSLGEHDAEHDRALDRAGLEARRVELFERVGLPPRR